MVKKLQALRAKKGFTLVELIVVIAIIGVLAAILVPTMMGMVTKARVTSADQTAKGLVDTVTTWLSDLESNKGEIPSEKTTIKIYGKCTTDDSGNNAWSEASGISIGNIKAANDTDGSKAINKLKDALADNYNFNSNISAIVIIEGRKVVGCAYCDSSSTDITATLESIFTTTCFRAAGFDWGGKTDGVYEAATEKDTLGGKTIGTSPKLLIDNASDVGGDD